LLCWGNHRRVAGARENSWDDDGIGGSALPIRIKEGWLEIYHDTDKNDRSCLGALLLDANEPWKVLARRKYPILEPEANYEINDFFGKVIFSCSVLAENNKIKILKIYVYKNR